MVRIFSISAIIFFSQLAIADYASFEGEEIRFAQEKVEDQGAQKWKLTLSGLVDLRYSATGKERAIQDTMGGFGGRSNLRYGGVDRDNDGKGDISGNAFHLGHLDLLSEVEKNKEKFAHIHLLADEKEVGVFEAFLINRKPVNPNLSFGIRAGLMIPEVSLENTAIGWTSPYTISTSAVNTWFGEELKVLGIEPTVSYNWGNFQLSLNGSLFSGNDGLGSSLSWRGWALHDNYSYHGKPLQLRQQAFIPAGTVDPFIESDNSLGHYTKLELAWNNLLKINYFYLNNNADPNIRDTTNQNWAWDTSFHHLGFQVGPFHGFELLGQVLKGQGEAGRAPVVDNKFEAGYLLLTKRLERWSGAVRWDAFRVMDEDTNTDRNQQHGQAKTLGLNYHIHTRQLIMGEVIFSDNRRIGNETSSNGDNQQYKIYQLAYKLIF